MEKNVIELFSCKVKNLDGFIELTTYNDDDGEVFIIPKDKVSYIYEKDDKSVPGVFNFKFYLIDGTVFEFHCSIDFAEAVKKWVYNR